jgi:hypothetical protein
MMLFARIAEVLRCGARTKPYTVAITGRLICAITVSRVMLTLGVIKTQENLLGLWFRELGDCLRT